MSDSLDSADPVVAPSSTPVTAGRLLREAREAAGLHIASLAVSLKVPVRKLELLEADRFDELPDAVFVRALASSVCRNLKMDPALVLPHLPQTSAPRLAADDGGINAPFRGPSELQSASAVDHLSKPVLLSVLALLLGALVLIFLPSVRQQAPVAVESPVAAGAAVQVPQSSANGPAVAAARDASTTAAVSAVPAAAAPAGSSTPGLSVALSTPAVVSPTVVVSASPTLAKQAGVAVPGLAGGPAGTPVSPDTGMVVFKARGESWVEVTDARGEVALRRTLAAGETAGASGFPPLSVVIGRVNVTDVLVRGKTFDLSTVAKDNVARFEVK